MRKIFRVYASHGPHNYAELDLPASDYEMLDLMERLRLGPGQNPHLEVLKCSEEYNYLSECIRDQPDIYQLNALAKKLSEFTSTHDMAAFEGLVGKEMEKGALPIAFPKLIDFAYSTDCCHVAVDAVTDPQLGKFLVENEFVEAVNGLPESALDLLDYGKIGREHREQADGIYTDFGYVEQYSEVRHISETMDFQLQKPAYTVLLNVAVRSMGVQPRQADILQIKLPAPGEHLRELMEKLRTEDWNDVVASVQDCSIPGLNQEMYLDNEMPQVIELAQHLAELDSQGKLTKYKALLAAKDCRELSQMISLAGAVDEYILDQRTSSPEDLAREELRVVVSSPDAETLLPHVDLVSYGRALLEKHQSVITKYGMLVQVGEQQLQDMEQDPSPGGMVMG